MTTKSYVAFKTYYSKKKSVISSNDWEFELYDYETPCSKLSEGYVCGREVQSRRDCPIAWSVREAEEVLGTALIGTWAQPSIEALVQSMRVC